MMSARVGTKSRQTKETSVEVTIDLENSGEVSHSTAYPVTAAPPGAAGGSHSMDSCVPVPRLAQATAVGGEGGYATAGVTQSAGAEGAEKPSTLAAATRAR